LSVLILLYFQDIIRYTALAIAIPLALIGYAAIREDVDGYINECDKEYPGDPGCDELRELHDNFLAPVVSQHKLKFVVFISMIVFDR